MPNILSFNHTKTSDGQNHLVIYDDDFKPYLVTSEHPRWDDILKLTVEGDSAALDLIDVGSAISRTFLSERVSYSYNQLFFDGDAIDGALVDHIIATINENGVDAATPLVNFLEKVNQNPSENSRNQLYTFLEKHNFTITDDGDFVGYKSVYRDGDGYLSVSAGPAIINGKVHEAGKVPQAIGDVIEMERSNVVDDPYHACSRGLHVANWRYAKTFSGDVKLAVLVNPRDVVSVPVDSHNEKIRCCRYRILDEVDSPFTTTLLDNVRVPTSNLPDYWDWVEVRDGWDAWASDEYETFIDYVEDCWGEFVQVNAKDDPAAAMNRENWRLTAV